MVENHMTSETRTAILLDESAKQVVADRLDEIEEIAVVVTLEAIPWCTTHHRSVELGFQLISEPLKCRVSSRQWKSHLGFRWADHPLTCEVSQGGPDHKWWKTT